MQARAPRTFATICATAVLSTLTSCEWKPTVTEPKLSDARSVEATSSETGVSEAQTSLDAVDVTRREPTIVESKEIERESATATIDEQRAVSGRDLVLGARLLEQTRSGENAVISPWSLAQALALTQAGARGETAKAFEQVIRGPISDADWHRTRSAIESAVKVRGAGAVGKDGGPFRLSVFNRLYGGSGVAFDRTFLDTLARHYGAGLATLDFVHAPGEARDQINREVAKATENLIKALLSAEHIKSSTALVLVNAVYFNAGWRTPFDKARTALAPFHRSKHASVDVPTMVAEKVPVRSAVVDGIEVLELPYDGEQVSMLILMPPEEGMARLEKRLASGWLADSLTKLTDGEVKLYLPRFKLRSKVDAAAALRKLGLAIAFDASRADFTGMVRSPPGVLISDVVQEAIVETDEAGTVAAAATAAVVILRSMPIHPVVRIDRPFLFLIHDNETRAPLFLGRVVDPR